MSDIPSELEHEILLRLPAETLLRCRAVCKTWRRTIDDPSFARSHFVNNQLSSPNLLIRSKTDHGALYSFSLDSLIHANGEQIVDATRVNYLARQDMAQTICFPMATCNGLILISNRLEENRTWVIWNPFTNDFHELPKPDTEVNSERGCGLGYDSASDDYKVVLIDAVSHDVYRTFVYSLRLNSWKKIMDCPSHLGRYTSEFLNGALYWKSDYTIIVLDLAIEEYHQLALPKRKYPLNTVLVVLDGCLVVRVSRVNGARVWLMKEDGVESWVELFSSEEQHVIDGWCSQWDLRHLPIAYSKSQRQLILRRGNENIVWDIEKGSAKMVTIHGLHVPLSFQICPKAFSGLRMGFVE